MSFYTDSHGRRRPLTQKTIFGPAKNIEASEHIRLDTLGHAEESIRWLNSEWSDGTHDRRVKLVQYANQAANRAGIIGDNRRVTASQRDEAKRVERIYRSWVDDHKGRESAPKA